MKGSQMKYTPKNHPRVLVAEQLPGKGSGVFVKFMGRVPVFEERISVRTTKADGTLLKVPVRTKQQVQVGWQSGPQTVEAKRRKTLRKLGVRAVA